MISKEHFSLSGASIETMSYFGKKRASENEGMPSHSEVFRRFLANVLILLKSGHWPDFDFGAFGSALNFIRMNIHMKGMQSKGFMGKSALALVPPIRVLVLLAVVSVLVSCGTGFGGGGYYRLDYSDAHSAYRPSGYPSGGYGRSGEYGSRGYESDGYPNGYGGNAGWNNQPASSEWRDLADSGFRSHASVARIRFRMPARVKANPVVIFCADGSAAGQNFPILYDEDWSEAFLSAGRPVFAVDRIRVFERFGQTFRPSGRPELWSPWDNAYDEGDGRGGYGNHGGYGGYGEQGPGRFYHKEESGDLADNADAGDLAGCGEADDLAGSSSIEDAEGALTVGQAEPSQLERRSGLMAEDLERRVWRPTLPSEAGFEPSSFAEAVSAVLEDVRRMTGMRPVVMFCRQDASSGWGVDASDVASIIADSPAGLPAANSAECRRLASAGIPIAIYVDDGSWEGLGAHSRGQGFATANEALRFANRYAKDGGDATVTSYSDVAYPKSGYHASYASNNLRIARHMETWIEGHGL